MSIISTLLHNPIVLIGIALTAIGLGGRVPLVRNYPDRSWFTY
jgi:hypothetical protein